MLQLRSFSFELHTLLFGAVIAISIYLIDLSLPHSPIIETTGVIMGTIYMALTIRALSLICKAVIKEGTRSSGFFGILLKILLITWLLTTLYNRGTGMIMGFILGTFSFLPAAVILRRIDYT